MHPCTIRGIASFNNRFLLFINRPQFLEPWINGLVRGPYMYSLNPISSILIQAIQKLLAIEIMRVGCGSTIHNYYINYSLVSIIILTHS